MDESQLGQKNIRSPIAKMFDNTMKSKRDLVFKWSILIEYLYIYKMNNLQYRNIVNCPQCPSPETGGNTQL